MDKKCKNCRLFNSKDGLCAVVILHNGERIHLPVDADDDCFYENQFTATDALGRKDSFKVEVQQVKFWVEDPKTGEKIDGNGVVKIEYPEGFFGKKDSDEADPI